MPIKIMLMSTDDYYYYCWFDARVYYRDSQVITKTDFVYICISDLLLLVGQKHVLHLCVTERWKEKKNEMRVIFMDDVQSVFLEIFLVFYKTIFANN